MRYHQYRWCPVIEARRLQRLYDCVWVTQRNCRFEDIRLLLLAVGLRERPARGSHVTFSLEAWHLTIPTHDPVPRYYVKRALKLAKEIMQRG